MDIQTLKKSRASFKSKLTVFKKFLDTLLPSKTINSVQAHELTIRNGKMQEMYNDFDSVQNDIEGLTDIPDDEYAERAAFENSYFSAMAVAQDLLSRHAAVNAATAAGNDSASVSGSGVIGYSELQSRSKWRTRGTQPQLGEMVVVKDDRLPPNRWLIGRITGVHPGSDGVNRVADVLTTTGTLRRAYNRLCPLPAALDQDAPDPRGAACLRHI
ncbi:uncharacterized protein LOC123723166 [Papilio machaon]|uniref:uncharacterized protein LOC123721171 n=1 Tax=Papilio machaon TaxID=76193 RepID=UPI001E664D59|nr:uncharacterized protein LOC123721171 [Papilio machaon]XP_045537365.1 uncharacterized protein LOC123721747 [Papilio machaon]XP_045541683.1 uncharacterized protein LOC123723166 [Papilio machaon]